MSKIQEKRDMQTRKDLDEWKVDPVLCPTSEGNKGKGRNGEDEEWVRKRMNAPEP